MASLTRNAVFSARGVAGRQLLGASSLARAPRLTASRRFQAFNPMLSNLHSSRRLFASDVSPKPEVLPAEIPVDEELLPGYKSDAYYPANPGDALDSYKLVAKLGWGSSSTVWLAIDQTSDATNPAPSKYVALKIFNNDQTEKDKAHTIEISKQLMDTSQGSPASAILAAPDEAFKVDSLGKEHLVLSFKPLREPLWLFLRRITGKNAVTHETIDYMKAYIHILLTGIHHMHTQARLIHTDLKLDNIMVSFEDQETIDKYVKSQETNPMARKESGNRTVYRSHNNFGPLSHVGRMIPQITDFGLAQRGDKSDRYTHPIQPNEYRAPEVVLGLGWTYSTDIWNFGAMLWELLDGQSLFRQTPLVPYSPAQHLANITALLGEAPASIAQREKDSAQTVWEPAVPKADGQLATNAAQFYGGPFFNEQGKFVHDKLVPTGRSLSLEVPQCVMEDGSNEKFLDFMGKMLRWVPEERATAAELLQHPWLNE